MSAIIPYLQPGALTNAQSDITDLQALSGMPDNSLTHGTFSGVTIPDGQTTKQALQALETEIELRDSDIISSKAGIGSAYYFDGLNDRVTGISANVLNSDSFTYFADVNPADTSGIYGIIFGIGGGAFTNRRYLKYDNGSYSLTIGDTTSAIASIEWPAVPARIAVTHDGATSTAKIYINGKLVQEVIHAQQFSVASAPITSVSVGDISSAQFFKGEMHEVQVFNHALNNNEVSDISNGKSLGFAGYGPSGVVGKKYRITSFQAGDDFTNVGAATNATGVEFVATGTTPTTWSNSSGVLQIGMVLDLNGFGMSPTVWFDHSGNTYNGTINGAARINPLGLAADKILSLTNLPTSASGLASGRVWNDSGTLKIV
jgi:hypothetical protein